jgi:hypothetical protein
VAAASVAKGLTTGVDLHVVVEPRGHTTPPDAPRQAAAWIRGHLETASTAP